MLTNKEVVEQIIEGKKKYLKVYPQHVVRASEIGHPCERYLVYSITHWAERAPYSAEVQFIFEGGRLVEELALQDFRDAGFKVYQPEPDKAIMEATPKITGHFDTRVDLGDGKVYTIEIKGLNIYDFNSLHSIDDFHNSKKPWIKKYPGQLMTYMYIKNEEVGAFYIKSIPRFQPKWIWVSLDYGYMENLLRKTERVQAHVLNKTLPEPVSDLAVCEYCGFKHICLPDVMRDSMEFIDNEELAALLDEWHKLKPYQKEYNAIDRQLKDMIKEKERMMIGNYLITGGWIDKKESTTKASRYWKPKIINLTEQGDDQ